MPTLNELTSSECEELLRAGVFGRLVVLAGPRDVEVFPVNYVVVDDAVVVRTAPGTMLDRYGDEAAMLFEVDQVDHERCHGWSVVARGHGERVAGADRTEDEQHTPGPPRWLRRDDETWIRLRWDELSGRRIGSGWDCAAGMPVRRAWR